MSPIRQFAENGFDQFYNLIGIEPQTLILSLMIGLGLMFGIASTCYAVHMLRQVPHTKQVFKQKDFITGSLCLVGSGILTFILLQIVLLLDLYLMAEALAIVYIIPAVIGLKTLNKWHKKNKITNFTPSGIYKK